jgi:hypothetical protein
MSTSHEAEQRDTSALTHIYSSINSIIKASRPEYAAERMLDVILLTGWTKKITNSIEHPGRPWFQMVRLLRQFEDRISINDENHAPTAHSTEQEHIRQCEEIWKSIYRKIFETKFLKDAMTWTQLNYDDICNISLPPHKNNEELRQVIRQEFVQLTKEKISKSKSRPPENEKQDTTKAIPSDVLPQLLQQFDTASTPSGDSSSDYDSSEDRE